MPINNLLIDFDHTIFNSSQIKYEWAGIFEKCGVAKEAFWRTYPLARYGEGGRPVYSPRVHAELLKDLFTRGKEEVLEMINAVKKRGADFLFPDVKKFLSRMVSLNVSMTLILHGEKEYQKEKAESTGIIDYFAKLHYSDSPRYKMVEELKLNPQDKIFWISHNLNDMVEVKKRHPFIILIIKRSDDIPIIHYRETGFLNFNNFEEMQEYLTIVQATSY